MTACDQAGHLQELGVECGLAVASRSRAAPPASPRRARSIACSARREICDWQRRMTASSRTARVPSPPGLRRWPLKCRNASRCARPAPRAGPPAPARRAPWTTAKSARWHSPGQSHRIQPATITGPDRLRRLLARLVAGPPTAARPVPAAAGAPTPESADDRGSTAGALRARRLGRQRRSAAARSAPGSGRRRAWTARPGPACAPGAPVLRRWHPGRRPVRRRAGHAAGSRVSG
jgi:hypothetical protein